MTTALARLMPLVLKRRAAAFDNPDWLFDLKYDGFRALLEIDRGEAHLVSRNRSPPSPSPYGRTRMIVFPLRRSVGFKAATASSRVATLPMFVRSRPSRTR